MISESTIDECIELLAKNETDYLQAMSDDQPVLAGYLNAEDIEAFTPEETQYLYYLAVLIWMCFNKTYPEIDEIEEETLSLREEQNWHRIQTLRPSTIKNIFDRILPESREQELLFYLEDALQIDDEDPEHPMTRPAQIPMLTTLITVVDVMTEASR